MPDLFFDILDQKRMEILPLLKSFKDDFYLAGGTALALQIGHRDSIDFDFFADKPFDTAILFEKIQSIFSEHTIQKIQEEKNTLGVLIDDKIKISFMTFPYLLIDKVKTDNLILASILDIAAMKLNAITSRSANKDYVDLFFILKQFSLDELFGVLEKKNMNINKTLITKSLVYFEDMENTPIIYKHGHETDFETIKDFLRTTTSNYLNTIIN